MTKPSSSFVRLSALDSPALRLFCFPYAGAGIAPFRPWREAMPAGVELIGAQPPGRGPRLREAPHRRMKPLVNEMALAMAPMLDRPFALFGHSLGALMAFELARLLRRHGKRPAILMVSGTIAAHQPNTNPPLHHLPDAQFIAELARLNGMPREILDNRELLEIVLPAVKADFEVLETYEYAAEAPLDTPIRAFGGTHDPRANHDQLDAWRAQTSAAFDLCMFDGGHFFMDERAREFLHCMGEKIQFVLRDPRGMHCGNLPGMDSRACPSSSGR